MTLQPKRKLNSNVKNDASANFNGPEFSTGRPNMPAGTKDGFDNQTFEYPQGAGLSNMVAIYFNELNNLYGSAENPVSGINDNFQDYAGLGLDSTAVPTRNLAYQSLVQGQTFERTVSSVPDGEALYKKLKENVFSTYLRTTNIVWLMMPQMIRFGTNANWQELNFDPNALGLLSMAAADKSPWRSFTSVLGKEVTEMVANMAGAGDIGSALTHSIQNTYNDMNFANMQRRQFQFNWTLAPKSEAELMAIDNIITLLRFHAHPSFSDVGSMGTYLNFPGQVNLEWYTKDEKGEYLQNAWLPKISSCVISGIETDYTPNSQFSFFKNSGAPTQINLSLMLTEVHPLVKQDIARGF